MPLKPEEISAAFAFLGYEFQTVESVDQFKESFGKDFVKRDQVIKDKEIEKQFIGKIKGGIQTKLEQDFASFGIEFDAEEKKLKIEELVKTGLEKHTKLTSAAIADAKKTSEAPTEAFKALEEKYGKTEQKLKDTEKLKNELATEYDGYKNTVAIEKKTGKVKDYVENAWGKFKWGTTDEYRKKGFKSDISEKIRIELDENDRPYPVDVKTGERIKSTKKASEFVELDEILEIEGVKAGMLDLKDNKPKPPIQQQRTRLEPTPGEPIKQEVYIHPKALEYAARQE